MKEITRFKMFISKITEEPIQFVQEEIESNSNLIYSVGGKRLKLENGKIFNLEGIQQFTDELGILNQVSGRESSVQYAVIKDGQLHLQLSEDDSVEILNENDFKALKKPKSYFNLIESPSVIFNTENQINFIKPDDNIQVIFDDDLLKGDQNLINQEEIIPKEESNNFLNQKFTIGRKPNGKCLVGRILNIQTPQNQPDHFRIDFNTGDIENVLNEAEINQNQIDFISKTLNGLAELPTLQKKLLNTNLQVKLIEKIVDNQKKTIKKNEFYGVLIEYVNENNEKFYRFNLGTNLGFDQKTSLIIALNITKLGDKEKVSTKVTFLDEKIEKSSPFVCGICSKSFKNQNLLLKHASNDHLEQFPFDLNGKMKSGNEKSDLFFVCFQCTMNFKSISELNEHKKRVHGSGSDKFFYCETCGRQFSRHSNLIRHEVIHNGEGNLYNCTICGSSYKFVSSLTRHIVQNHVGKS
nr:zinc finger protein 836-like isoform X2 [Onthophagus taurus]